MRIDPARYYDCIPCAVNPPVIPSVSELMHAHAVNWLLLIGNHINRILNVSARISVYINC